MNKVSPAINKTKKVSEPKTQLAAFQQAMKLLFVIGQIVGLTPVRGILEADIREKRFSVCYWRFLHCMLIGIAQGIATTLCLYRLLKGTVTIGALGYFSFYAATCITTFLFIQMGSKWPQLMKDISKSKLDEYIDPRVKAKCYIASVVIISSAIIEHLLSLLYRVENILSCHENINVYEELLKYQFPWVFELNVPRYVPIGIILQIINVTSTMNWNFSDLFIMCMSIYLTSILDKINAKVISASEKHYLPSSYWRALREDYNRATRLVRSFDDVISGIIFTSFASNLFFICLQVFNILAHGVKSRQFKGGCLSHSNGPFGGYEYTAYLLFSIIYIFARSLTVSLVAASVNTASLVPAPALYSVPSSAFCDEAESVGWMGRSAENSVMTVFTRTEHSAESTVSPIYSVSRFIAQVNGDNIALSGLQFFYVTRDLVLSVAGTIVTYELVLLQFSGDE